MGENGYFPLPIKVQKKEVSEDRNNNGLRCNRMY